MRTILSTSSTPERRAASFGDLPSEIITAILEYGMEEGRQYTGRRRYEFLCVAILVSRSVREEAQRLLWVDVFVKKENVALAMLESGVVGRYQTNSLELSAGEVDHPTQETLARLLPAFQELKHLTFYGFERRRKLNLSICSHLKHLSSLSLINLTLEVGGANDRAPFTVDSLKLLEYESTNRFNIYSYFADCKIREFTLYRPLNSDHYPSFITFLSSISTTLKDLNFLTGMVHRSLIPSFSTFINLQRLNVTCSPKALQEIIQLLPSSSLRELSLSTTKPGFAEAILEVVEEKSLENLKVVKWPYVSREEVEKDGREWGMLEDTLKKRGCRMEFK